MWDQWKSRKWQPGFVKMALGIRVSLMTRTRRKCNLACWGAERSLAVHNEQISLNDPRDSSSRKWILRSRAPLGDFLAGCLCFKGSRAFRSRKFCSSEVKGAYNRCSVREHYLTLGICGQEAHQSLHNRKVIFRHLNWICWSPHEWSFVRDSCGLVGNEIWVRFLLDRSGTLGIVGVNGLNPHPIVYREPEQLPACPSE